MATIDNSGPHRWISALPVAVMFLTRLPSGAPKTRLSGAVVAFPLIGLGVGALGGGAYWLALLAGLPPLVCALIAPLATVICTGALHEDGLADMADGMAGKSPEESIGIMRDSRTGSYGVLALIFSVGLRAAAVMALAEPLVVLVAMAASGALSRAAMPVVMRILCTASGRGLAAAAGRPATLDVLLGIVIAGGLAYALLGPVAVIPAGGAIVGMCAVAAVAQWRLRGYTGDSLGAVQQVAEISGLLALIAIS